MSVLKKLAWPLITPAIFCGLILLRGYGVVTSGGSYVYLLVIPLYVWVAGLLLQNDRLCSTVTRYLYLLVTLLCLALGIVLYRYDAFPEKRGGMVVLFGCPLVVAVIFEGGRLIYRSIRHETPCINYRSGRWIGDAPRNGFYTTYPEDKVISWADVLFGFAVTIVSLLAPLTLIIWSFAANW